MTHFYNLSITFETPYSMSIPGLAGITSAVRKVLRRNVLFPTNIRVVCHPTPTEGVPVNQTKTVNANFSLYTIVDASGNFVGFEKTSDRATERAASIGGKWYKFRYDVALIVPQESCEQKLAKKDAEIANLQSKLTKAKSFLV